MTYNQYKLIVGNNNESLDDTVDGRYHYVYRITNLIENKHYYGSRSSTCEPIMDLGIKYFSSISSSAYKWIVKDQKINKCNYKYKVLKVFNTNKEKIIYESYLHYKFDVKNNAYFYNLSNQTPTGFNTNGITGNKHPLYGKPRDTATKIKISNALTNKYKHTEHPNYGVKRPLFSLTCSGSNNPMWGRKHSKETLALYSSSRKGENNPRAKSINIYDAKGDLVQKCKGNFKKICYCNNYPLGAFNTALKKSLPVYHGTIPSKIINAENRKFIGWVVSYG